jgi:NADH-quinone oxidoreductase subunit E
MSEQLKTLPAGALALSDEELAAIDAEIAHAPYREAVAIDALKIVQEHRGWVSDESLKALAAYLDMSAAELDGIATFYNLIFRRPVGENVILVCNSVSCWIKGCEGVRQAISGKLGIEPGETTEDGKFTLLPITCLGACDKAPVMMVGGQKFEDVTPEGIDAILDDGKGATPA